MSLVLRRLKSTSQSSRQWLERQANDPYVKKAQEEGYRARSAFKLLEINQKHKLLKPGMTVIECGAAPGAWTQVAAEKVNAGGMYRGNGKEGVLIGCDLLNIEPILGAHLLPKSDFTLPSTQDKMKSLLNDRKVDLVLSDMAPNCSGMKSLDSEGSIKLVYSAIKFGLRHSKEGGEFLCKIWSGKGEEKLMKDLRRFYESVFFCQTQIQSKGIL